MRGIIMYEEAAILVNYRPTAVHLEKTIRDLWFPSQDDWEPSSRSSGSTVTP